MIFLTFLACATRVQGQISDIQGNPLAGAEINIANYDVKTDRDGAFRLVLENSYKEQYRHSLNLKTESAQSTIICLEPIKRRGNVILLGECRVIPADDLIPYLEQTQAPQIGD